MKSISNAIQEDDVNLEKGMESLRSLKEQIRDLNDKSLNESKSQVDNM